MAKKAEVADVEQIGVEPVDELAAIVANFPEAALPDGDLDGPKVMPEDSRDVLIRRLSERLENLEMAARPASVLTEEVLDGRRCVEIGLEGLVDAIPGICGGRARETVLMILRRRISSAEGKNGSAALAKAIARQINYAASDAELRPSRNGEDARQSLQTARCELAKGLALACAEHLEEAARECRAYGEAAAAWAEEKGQSDARLSMKVRPTHKEAAVLPVLRREREENHRRLAKALDSAWLAASGGEQ